MTNTNTIPGPPDTINLLFDTCPNTGGCPFPADPTPCVMNAGGASYTNASPGFPCGFPNILYLGIGYGPCSNAGTCLTMRGVPMADPIVVHLVPTLDCNGNGVEDIIEIDQGLLADCQPNGYPDVCDIGDGYSTDADGDGVPDECQTPTPTGACCLPGSACQIMTQFDCEVSGGTYAGDGTTCNPDPCLAGSDCCSEHPEPGCDTIGGLPAPGVADCVCAIDAVCCTSTWDNICALEVEVFGCADCPTGACCDFTFSCIDGLTQAECEAAPYSGFYQGDGSTCATDPCIKDPQFDSSCCLPDGGCIDNIDQDECEDVLGGSYAGGVLCSAHECVGSCCLPYCDPICLDQVYFSDCLNFYGGWYGGPGSTCEEISCLGACCYPDGTCLDNYLACECVVTGGTFLGLGSVCPPEPCAEPTGACCLPDCTCQDGVTQVDCQQVLGGEYGGDFSKCSELDCSGACCFPDGTCADPYLFCECDYIGGTFFGLGSLCADVADECIGCDCGTSFDCEGGAYSLIGAGVDDNFQNGPDSATPGAELLAAVPSCTFKDFDDPASDRCFGHTFTGLPNNISAATLCIHARPNAGNGLSCNDSISLQATGSSPAFAWSSRIGTGGTSCQPPVTGIHMNDPWVDPLPDKHLEYICLDLAALPNNATGSTPTNILPLINATGRLDIYIQDDSEVDFIHLDYVTCPKCVEPPSEMEAWWTFDADEGDVDLADFFNVEETVNNHDGAMVNFSLLSASVPGVVDEALTFDGVDDYISVPHSPGLDVGCGDWSYDAWINWDGTQAGTIVSKYAFFPAGNGGYSWGVNSSGQLCLDLETCFGSTPGTCDLGIRCQHCTTATISPNTWTHVALVFYGSGVVTMYINGSSVLSEATACICPTNVAPVLIGNSSFTGGLWDGEIDELEFFRRALGQTEIQAIYNAGAAGKCKEHCHVDWDFPICRDKTSVTVNTMKVCNDSSVTQTYQISINPLPTSTSPLCTVAGPPSVTITSTNPMSVGPGQCGFVTAIMTKPVGSVGDVGCYELIAQNLGSGHLLTCTGSIWLKDVWCGIIGGGGIGLPDLPIDLPTPVDFDVTNEDDSLPLPYLIDVMPSDMAGPNTAVALNGLPPGEPVIGILSVDPGNTGTIPVNVEIRDYEAFRFYDVILFTDDDHDGDYDPMISTGLRAAIPCAAALIFNSEDFEDAETDWQVIEDAQLTGGVARLVASGQTFGAGGAILNSGFNTDAFEVEFTFEISNPTGGVPDGSGQPDPDGLAFYVTGAPVAEVGGIGYGLGYQGFPTDSFAIEADAFHNFVSGQADDPDSNHLGLNVGGLVDSVSTAFVSPDFDESGLWHTRIRFIGGTVDVYLTPPGGTESLAYTEVVPAANIPATKYLGFTSGTGANSGDTDIDNVVIRLLDAGCDLDCNGNGMVDALDIAAGEADDNANGVPDACETLPPPPCEGDANGDNTVDPLDSGYVLARFGCSVGTGDPDCDAADVNHDGVVDPLDAGYVLARFGPCS